MANSVNISFRTFNLAEALAGASLAFVVGDSVSEYIYDFNISGSVGGGQSVYRGVNKIGRAYYFNSVGICLDGLSEHTLFIVDSSQPPTTGETAGNKCNEEQGLCTVLSITALNPREQIAVSAMTAILHSVGNPLNLSVNDISNIAKKSFEMAQSMLYEAVEHRRAASQEVEVTPANVSSMTDKLLYNINATLGQIRDKEEPTV